MERLFPIDHAGFELGNDLSQIEIERNAGAFGSQGGKQASPDLRARNR